MTLSRLEAAIPDRLDDALVLALAQWRTSFDPELGKLIEELGARCAKPLEDLPTKKKERAAALATLAAKTPAAGRSGVLAAFEGFARESTGGLVWPSVEAWAEVELDPRVARMALRVLSSEQELTGKLWRRLVNCVERHGDLGVVAEARKYEAGLRSGWGASTERFSNVLKKLTAARPCKDPLDDETVARLRRKLGTSAPQRPPRDARDQEAMLEAIAAAPDDDAPRLVYADWLTEQQDPRGEFITLQIRRAHRVATAAERKRETALFADHRKAFLAPFEKCVALSGLKFERGFLVAARVTTTLPASTLTRLLRSLEFEGGGFAPGARFDHLERADCSRVRTGYRLTGKAPRLREWTISAQTPEELEQWLGKTSLRVLHLKRIGAAVGAALPALYAHRALAQLEELDVQAPDLPVLSLKQAPATLRRFELQARSLNVALERGTKGWTGAVSAYPSTRRDELQTILRSEAFTHLTRLVMRCNEFSKRELLALAASIVKCPVTHELTSW